MGDLLFRVYLLSPVWKEEQEVAAALCKSRLSINLMQFLPVLPVFTKLSSQEYRDLPVLSQPVLFYRTQSGQQARFVSKKFDSAVI